MKLTLDDVLLARSAAARTAEDFAERASAKAWSDFYNSLDQSAIRAMVEAVDEYGDPVIPKKSLEFFIATDVWRMRNGLTGPVPTSLVSLPPNVARDDWWSRER